MTQHVGVVLAGIGLAFASGCGRLDFDPFTTAPPTDAEPVDAEPVDATTTDDAFADGLVLWMPLDVNAVTAERISGTDATCVDCPMPITDGARDSAARFDVDTCMKVPPDASRFLTELTAAVWLRAPQNIGESYAIAFAIPADGEAGVNDTVELSYDFGVESFQFISGRAANQEKLFVAWTPDLAWHHLAGTYTAARKRIYFDGVLVEEQATPNPIEFYAMDTLVGCDRNGGVDGLWFAGDIDDARLYNYELSPAQILTLASP